MMTIKNKILAILLAMSFNAFAAAWAGSASEPENMKKIDGKPFYVVTTAEELAWFANQVNSGKTTINAVLGNDIVFGKNTSSRTTKAWTPIGKDSSSIFNGVLDGAGHTVYGIYLSGNKFNGVVGILGKDGIVRNLSLRKGDLSVSNYAGAFVGLNVGTVQKCINGDSLFFGSLSAGVVAGAIVGRNEGVIEFSVSEAIEDSVGNTAIYPLDYFGGIAGVNTGTIRYSKNSASFSFTRSNSARKRFFGGVAGVNSGKIENCENSTGKMGLWADSTIFGGIVGQNNSGAVIRNAINKASIYGGSGESNHVGGVVGNNYGSILNSIVVCDVIQGGTNLNNYGTIAYRNYSSGSVKNTYYDSGRIKNAREFGYRQSNGATVDVGGKVTTDMKKDQFAWILNTTNGTTTNSGVWSRNGEYPIFADESNRAIYKIVFNDDGVTSNRYNTNKGTVSFPEDPEPAEGYIFTGWYNSSDIRVKPTTVFSADQTVNAVYVDASNVFWTINFYNTDAKSTLLETKSYQHGSVVAYNGETPTKETTAQYTYSFKGWDAEITNAVEDFDYHAVYDSTVRSYKIYFNNFDGTLIENATFEYGKMPSCSKGPSREATAEWKYSHKGWKPALDYVAGEATYVATYDSSKVEYKVTFLNGTTVIDEQMIPYGGAAVAPTNVTRDGYKFVGWNTTFSKITENLTVKALFEELTTYIVKVVGLNGEKIDSVKVEENGTYILPTAPKKEGYTFDAYYNGEKKIGTAGNEVSVTENITITAKYTKNPESSSSGVLKSSSSSAPKSSSSKQSSSSVRSSSSSVKSSSSSAKTSIAMKNITPRFNVTVGFHSVQISGAKVGTSYALLDMQGRVLRRGRVESANFNIAVPNAGQYFVGIDNQIRSVNVK